MRWEYLIYDLYLENTEEKAKVLNELSKEGWEVCVVFSNDEVLLKRPATLLVTTMRSVRPQEGPRVTE